MPEALARVAALCDGAADPPFGRLVRGRPLAPAVTAVRAAGLPTAVLPGALLYADAWESAHEAAQADSSPLGGWWHAILHRREPDAANALYWYRRAQPPADRAARLGHAVGAALRAAPVPGYAPPPHLAPFDPVPFVEACEAARAGRLSSSTVAALVVIQRLEWEAAMEWALAVTA